MGHIRCSGSTRPVTVGELDRFHDTLPEPVFLTQLLLFIVLRVTLRVGSIWSILYSCSPENIVLTSAFTNITPDSATCHQRGGDKLCWFGSVLRHTKSKMVSEKIPFRFHWVGMMRHRWEYHSQLADSSVKYYQIHTPEHYNLYKPDDEATGDGWYDDDTLVIIM